MQKGVDDIFADLGLADLASDMFAPPSFETQHQHQRQQRQDLTDMERRAGPGPTRSRLSPPLDADAMIGALLRDDYDVGGGAGRGKEGRGDFYAKNRNAVGLSSRERIPDDGIKREAMPWGDDYTSASSPDVIANSEKTPPLPELARRSAPTAPGNPTSPQGTPSPGSPSTVDNETPNTALPKFSDMDLLLPEDDRLDGHGDGQDWAAEVGRFEGYEDDNIYDRSDRPQNWSLNRSGNDRSGGDRVEEQYATTSAGRFKDMGRSSTISAVDDSGAAAELPGDVGDSFDSLDGFFEGEDQHVGRNLGDNEGSHHLVDSEGSSMGGIARLPAEIASGVSSVLVGAGDDAVEGRGGGGGGGKASDIAGMKVVELKARCKEMGLPVGGKKAELQQRILTALG